MALSAGLLLRQNQSLVMTPQLMQSIQLLQMTHIELTQFIAQELESNPLLEVAPADGEEAGGTDTLPDDPASEEPMDTSPKELDGDWFESEHTGHTERLSDELDTNFEAAYAEDGQTQAVNSPEQSNDWQSMSAGGEGGGAYDLEEFVAGQLSLREHLNQQIPFLLSDAGDQLVAQHLLDQLEDTGYIHTDLAELAERLGGRRDQVERVFARLQTLDPPGVFARSLNECLALQLRQQDRLDPAMAALVANLDLLARRDFASLKRICGVDEEDLLDMLAEIRALNPKPGSSFEANVSEAIVPDIVVRASSEGGWRIELNPETLPRVLVNQNYFASVSRHSASNAKDQAFLSECLQNANWLVRSLDQRAKTIMKVASEIVRQQDAFLLHGVDHLRPLNLKTIAEAIKMHESTVSRVTTNKYMLTPRGLFELKYFFTVSIGSAEGGDSHSAEAVRHKIRAMINAETPEAVLSDDDIVDMLKAGGIELARRTVAKYREAMNIPSSVQRRREKRAMAKVSSL